MIDLKDREQWFSLKQWFSLPLSLRQRWWKETNFNKVDPSAELLKLVQDTLEPK